MSDTEADDRPIPAVLAGIEAGVLGGVAMLAWLAAVSVWNGRSVWYIANLIASTFHGEAALRRGFRWMTLSGMALHFVACGLLGVAFAMVAIRLPHRRHVLFLGVFFGWAWYYLWYSFLWDHVNPLVPLYSPSGGMVLAHLALGIGLGLIRRPSIEQPMPGAIDAEPE